MITSLASFESIRRLVQSAQCEGRLPSLVAGVARGGQLVDHIAVGQADFALGVPAGPDVQYRIGSITKTITAAAIMQLAGEGKLDLRGPLSQGWAGAPHDDISLLDLLTHGSGLQREPPGSGWETLDFPTREELGASAERARRLYPQDSWWHYSNLGFALLGELVAQVTGGTWESYVQDRVLGPLQMTRTTQFPEAPAAQGYSVQPYADEVVAEPHLDLRGIAPAGQLWSTVVDLCRWSGALCGLHPQTISGEALAQMTATRTIADLEHWSWGFGLGLMLLRDRERIYVGHTGGMPGFLAAVVCDPETSWSVVLLTNGGAGVMVGQLAARLLSKLVEGEPAVSSWQPGEPPPERLRPLLGRWWSEWNEWVFRWRDGQLQAVLSQAPPGTLATSFMEIEPDRFVALNGTERGEELLVVRAGGPESPQVDKLYWATYPFTRLPRASGHGD
jgi:CubicO group peptidase (beta-lactamase class C family)